MKAWDDDIVQFVRSCSRHGIRMILVGGGAVNFHGYKRHSADVDFWIDTSEDNLDKLKKALKDIGISVDQFPEKVKDQQQNISIKFSPQAPLEIELITAFSLKATFEEAYKRSHEVSNADRNISWRVMDLEYLIQNKLLAKRNKDLLDVQELKRIHGLDRNSE